MRKWMAVYRVLLDENEVGVGLDGHEARHGVMGLVLDEGDLALGHPEGERRALLVAEASHACLHPDGSRA